ncbi:TonB-dependent receptor [Tenacibaculum sp. AHE15PA]|uniref:TonB-dependent receptor n=1 Tax=unclassified Tenacibaculum TaxID=2635139 RepID=UPI001C4FAC60|nr:MULTISPECIES: TonB-dependent receptor [unclassified Tenacibaculum]QXP72996.1 TonB-dependent receptor [Tenacibaculum sp. AHE14PA]QXP76910.1 TonB-dependent receptor [Tenacibaculum sp. AHE15PA]
MKQVITLFFLLTITAIFSQNLTIIDAETGKRIDEVAVFNKNKTISSISTIDGVVDITKFNDNEILIFSHVSYAKFQEKKAVLKQNNYQVFLSKQSEQLDEIVVSVFKNKEKANRIAEQIAVVSLKDIQKVSPQTSADLLATIPGIKVQKSQFGGGSPVLRGMESNRVLLVVDGVRMNNAIYRKGHLQSSITVNPTLLDRTEVVFGPSSVIYGSDALGGVIHYYTKTPKLSEENKIKGSSFLRYSSVNNEVTNSVSAELQFKNWASLTSVTHSNFGDLKMGKNRSHGFDDWGKTFFYSDNLNGNYAENPIANEDVNLQKNTGFSQTDFLQKFFIPLSKKTDLKVNIQYSTSSDVPRFDKLSELKGSGDLKFAEWQYGPQIRLLVSSQLEINPNKKWLNKGTITTAYQNIEESRIQRKFGSLERSYREENVNVFSVNGDFTVPLAKKRNLGYGFEAAYNDVKSNSYGKTLRINNNEIDGFDADFAVQSRYPDGGSSYFSSAMYLDYRQDITPKSTLNTGIRLTNTLLDAKWIDETFIQLPSNDISLNNTALTATIGYVFKPVKTLQLNAVLSSGFRSPNIDDVGKVREKNGDVTVPNITLKPEHAYNVEVGFQKYFNNRKFRVGANVYYTLLNNYIYRENFQLNGSNTVSYDGEDGNIVANVNKGTAYITGATVSYQGKIFNNWSTSGFLTYTKGKAYDTNLPMSSIPPLFGRFELNYSNNKFEGGANFVFNAKKDIADYNLDEGIDNQQQTPIVNSAATQDINKYYGTPSWMTVGLFAKYTVNANITIQTQLTNLFDEHYKEFASGVSAPGRNVSVSLLTNF